eukprot:9980157-Alexandrium_andersonii.AAC.1
MRRLASAALRLSGPSCVRGAVQPLLDAHLRDHPALGGYVRGLVEGDQPFSDGELLPGLGEGELAELR